MRVFAGALKLAIAVIASGCVSVAPNKSKALNARDLGLAYYFPAASVQIRQTDPLQFVIHTYLGEYAQPSTGQDAMAFPSFLILLTWCPIWNIAKTNGMAAAVIYKTFEGPMWQGEAHFKIVKSAPPAKEGEFVLDFSGPEWVDARSRLCDRTNELNQAWW